MSLSVDNASVNMGIRNSIRSRLEKVSKHVFIHGCPCHILHNAAGRASSALAKATGFDMEELAVDLSYWFDKSTKRKAGLEEYCVFCDTAYKNIISHVSTRWLSLEKVIDRSLELYAPLTSYFQSAGGSEARFKRLEKLFAKPMTQIYLLFLQSAIPLFTKLNLLLQRQEPSLHLLAEQQGMFMTTLLGRFVSPAEIVAAGSDWSSVPYENRAKQLADDRLYLGLEAREKLEVFIEDGSVSPHDADQFLHGVRCFYEEAVSYTKTRLPFDDLAVQNATFVDVKRRVEARIQSVHYFLKRFSVLFPWSTDKRKLEQLATEFSQYQVMPDSTISATAWEEARVSERVQDNDNETTVVHHRMDVLWGYLASLKDPVTKQPRFQLLCEVARLVLTLPHSNADEERVFSLIRQNKTDARSSLSLDGTLSSLICIKMANPEPCFRFEPPASVIERSKKVTREYNEEHRKKS